MAAPTAPNLAAVTSWDKSVSQLKPARKKNNSLTLIAVVAIVLLAVSGVWRATHQAAPGQFVQVVAPRRDLPPGTRLGFMSVSFLAVPKCFATKDMITSLNDIDGRVTRSFLSGGEPITIDMLFPGHDGLSLNLETHERAITLALSDDAAVDHAIAPDDRVDVLAVSAKDGKRFTKTICQDARVLMAVPKEATLGRSNQSANNLITLAVTPDLAEAITEAAETGKIRFVLRNRLSRVEQQLNGASLDDLLPAVAKTDKIIATKAAREAAAGRVAALPPPPIPPQIELDTEPGAGPLQWMVDIFAGSHKERVGVPQQ